MNEKLLFDFLKTHNIVHRVFEHQPVFTINDEPTVTAVDGVETSSEVVPKPHFKTLFLKDKKDRYFLVSVIEDKQVDLNALSTILECTRFSFGKAEDLLNLLRLTPGSVTPYGLMFDEHNKITFVLDEDTLKISSVGFHPLRNDKTIVTTPQVFLTCMEKMGHKPIIVKIPVKQKSPLN